MLLRGKHADASGLHGWRRIGHNAGAAFNRGFDKLSDAYAAMTRALVQRPVSMFVA